MSPTGLSTGKLRGWIQTWTCLIPSSWCCSMYPDVRGCRQTTRTGLRGPRTFKEALGTHSLVPAHPHAYLLALPTWPSLGFAPLTPAPLSDQIPTPAVQGCSPQPVQEWRGGQPLCGETPELSSLISAATVDRHPPHSPSSTAPACCPQCKKLKASLHPPSPIFAQGIPSCLLLSHRLPIHSIRKSSWLPLPPWVPTLPPAPGQCLWDASRSYPPVGSFRRHHSPLETWRWQGIICQCNEVLLCATPSLAPNADRGMQVPPLTHPHLRAERFAKGPQQGQVELGVDPAAWCQHPWCRVVGGTLWADVCRSGATAGSHASVSPEPPAGHLGRGVNRRQEKGQGVEICSAHPGSSRCSRDTALYGFLRCSFSPHFGVHLILKCGGCRSPHTMGCPVSLGPGFVLPPHRDPPQAWVLSPGKGMARATGTQTGTGLGSHCGWRCWQRWVPTHP